MSRARPHSRTASPGSAGVPPASGTCRRFRPRLRTRAQTTNILYTINRKQGLHPAKQWGKEPCAGLKITPPWRGSRRDQGEARGRAGGGAPPPRLVIYRENEKNIGSPAWRPGATPHRISLRLSARLLRLPLLGARASRPHPVTGNAPSPASPWPTAPSPLERGSPPGCA